MFPVFCPLSIDIPQQEWGDIGEFRERWMNLWLYRMLYRLYPLPWGAQGGPRSYYSVPSICFLFMEVRRWYLSFGVFNQFFFAVLPWQNNIFTLQKLFLFVPLFPDLILNFAQVAVPKVCCLKIVCPQIWWFILNCPFQHDIWWI